MVINPAINGKIIINKNNDYDFMFQPKDESFTIKYGIRIIKIVSFFNILCSLTLSAIRSTILYNGGTQWSGHLPHFVVK